MINWEWNTKARKLITSSVKKHCFKVKEKLNRRYAVHIWTNWLYKKSVNENQANQIIVKILNLKKKTDFDSCKYYKYSFYGLVTDSSTRVSDLFKFFLSF